MEASEICAAIMDLAIVDDHHCLRKACWTMDAYLVVTGLLDSSLHREAVYHDCCRVDMIRFIRWQRGEFFGHDFSDELPEWLAQCFADWCGLSDVIATEPYTGAPIESTP